jgi:hypothetical protein
MTFLPSSLMVALCMLHLYLWVIHTTSLGAGPLEHVLVPGGIHGYYDGAETEVIKGRSHRQAREGPAIVCS